MLNEQLYITSAAKTQTCNDSVSSLSCGGLHAENP